MDWKEQPVFISSTFNDMHAERDYLMKNVFPQLGEWCERRHIILRDIDLRWGVPPTVLDDPDSQNTILKTSVPVRSSITVRLTPGKTVPPVFRACCRSAQVMSSAAAVPVAASSTAQNAARRKARIVFIL